MAAPHIRTSTTQSRWQEPASTTSASSTPSIVTATGTVNGNGCLGLILAELEAELPRPAQGRCSSTASSTMPRDGAPARPTQAAKNSGQSPPATDSTATAMSSNEALLNR